MHGVHAWSPGREAFFLLSSLEGRYLSVGSCMLWPHVAGAVRSAPNDTQTCGGITVLVCVSGGATGLSDSILANTHTCGGSGHVHVCRPFLQAGQPPLE